MEKDQNLQKVSNNIFNKVYKFFKSLFYNKNTKTITQNTEQRIQTEKDEENKDDFRKNIEISENKDKTILLKQKFDNKMINVRDIPMKEKMELLEMYKQEILENRNRLKRLGRL